MNTVDGPFLAPIFCRAPFCTVSAPPNKQKKGRLRKVTKISDYVFFILVIFLQKTEIFAYFCFFFQIFYVFDKQNSTYLEFYQNSVSDSFFALKARLFAWTLFLHDFRQILGAKTNRHCIRLNKIKT